MAGSPRFWGGEGSSPKHMALDCKDMYKSLSCMYSIISFKYRAISSVIYSFLLIQ